MIVRRECWIWAHKNKKVCQKLWVYFIKICWRNRYICFDCISVKVYGCVLLTTVKSDLKEAQDTNTWERKRLQYNFDLLGNLIKERRKRLPYLYKNSTIHVFCPHLQESKSDFNVTKKEAIRYTHYSLFYCAHFYFSKYNFTGNFQLKLLF